MVSLYGSHRSMYVMNESAKQSFVRPHKITSVMHSVMRKDFICLVFIGFFSILPQVNAPDAGWIPRRTDSDKFQTFGLYPTKASGWGRFYADRALCLGLLRKGDIMRKLAFFSLLAILLCSCVNKGVVADPASTSDEAKPVEAQESPKADESKPSDVAKDGDEVKPSDNKPEDEAPKANDVKPDEAPKANDVKPDEAPKASDTKLVEAPAK